MDNPPVVIYHADCLDGWCAALVALHRCPDAEIVPASYGSDPPDVTGRDVLVVDFSYPRAVLEAMRDRARSLLVLDHHATAQEDLAGLDYAVFDMGQSGAGMAWRTLFPWHPVPWVVRYVEDRDLWRHALPDSAEVNAYLRTLPRWGVGDASAWDALFREAVPVSVVEAGRAVLGAQREYVRAVVATAETGVLGTYVVPVVNAPRWSISELLHELCVGQPFALGWRRMPGGYEYSLRSREDGVDVSEVAKQYGGGGHRCAAGFTAAEPVHRYQMNNHM